MKDYKGAIEDCSKVIDVDNNCENAYFNRGMAYLILQNYEKAHVDFTRAYDINPKNEEARRYMMYTKKMMINYKDVV